MKNPKTAKIQGIIINLTVLVFYIVVVYLTFSRSSLILDVQYKGFLSLIQFVFLAFLFFYIMAGFILSFIFPIRYLFHALITLKDSYEYGKLSFRIPWYFFKYHIKEHDYFLISTDQKSKVFSSDDGNCAFTIYKKKKRPIQELLESMLYKGQKHTAKKIKKLDEAIIKIDKAINATKYSYELEYKYDLGTMKTTLVFIPYNSKFYVLQDYWSIENHDKHLDQILSTFKFTK